MKTISKRISDILKSKEVDINDLSQYIGVDVSIVYTWRRKENLPSTDNLILLSKYTKLSMDYLLCRTDNDEEVNFDFNSTFDIRLNQIMKEQNVSQYKMVTKDKILSSSYFNRYLVKKKLPSLEVLIRLSDYFNTSVDFLLGRD